MLKKRVPSGRIRTKSAPIADKLAKSEEKSAPGPDRRDFSIVAIGASAGGLDAFTRLLRRLPANTGMAFVLIQHLAPQHESMLAPILSQTTTMPVTQVRNHTRVKPNHIHVIPPNTQLSISGGMLILKPRIEGPGGFKPIDHFFRSLAADQKSRAIGVILSGTDNDGSRGLQAIKAEGGIVVAQDEESAAYFDMPRNAIATGQVDLVLPPEEIAEELARIGRHTSAVRGNSQEAVLEDKSKEGASNRIFALLRRVTGVDFRQYKPNTIERRLHRRMMLQHCQDLDSYVALVETHPAETEALYSEILIHVTSFFRDPQVFRALRRNILPQLLKSRATDTPLRIWVPGCSTGEEVYSLAMCVFEVLGRSMEPRVQIFGTDLDERAIARARTAIYPEDQVLKLPAERVHRFFAEVDHGYQIHREVRDACVFARHNLLADPPFSRLDMISCRNVLIYLKPPAQQKVIRLFQHALRHGGVLLLGLSESIQGFGERFAVVDKKNKFYLRTMTAAAPGAFNSVEKSEPILMPPVRGVLQPSFGARAPRAEWTDLSIQHAVDRIIAAKHGPPGVVVNSEMDVVQSHGDISPYVHIGDGAVSLNIFKLASEGLRTTLRGILSTAMKENSAQAGAAHVLVNGQLQIVQLTAGLLPSDHGRGPRFLILFYPPVQPDASTPQSLTSTELAPSGHAPEHARGQRKLAITQGDLDSLFQARDDAIQELTAAHEELQSANEELQSANEEMQSTNEELQTAKEELQAINEELSTTNDELHHRNTELSRLSDDLTNLVSSTTLPIVILDNDLRIRRITPATEQVMNLRPSDIGRPVTDIRMKLGIEDLEPVLREVQETLGTKEVELRDREGLWYFLRVRPYRTSDNRIEGLVLLLVDITQQKHAEMIVSKERSRLETVLAKEATHLKAEKSGRKKLEGALHESEDALLHSRKQLRALAGKLFRAQDEERRRVSRELHDDLSQRVAHIEFNVQRLEQLPSNPKKIKEGLKIVRGQVGSFSGDLRRIAYQLHPSALDVLGLDVAVRSYAAEFSKREGIRVKVKCGDLPVSLAPNVSASLYRVIQEALHNVSKHAGSGTAVTITLAQSGHELKLSIHDNGPGFDVHALGKNRGLGLISMQERVRLLHGTFSLTSRPGLGTRIVIRILLTANSLEKRQ
jgi:two-component system CheB/CheR fusion protein